MPLPPGLRRKWLMVRRCGRVCGIHQSVPTCSSVPQHPGVICMCMRPWLCEYWATLCRPWRMPTGQWAVSLCCHLLQSCRRFQMYLQSGLECNQRQWSWKTRMCGLWWMCVNRDMSWANFLYKSARVLHMLLSRGKYSLRHDLEWLAIHLLLFILIFFTCPHNHMAQCVRLRACAIPELFQFHLLECRYFYLKYWTICYLEILFFLPATHCIHVSGTLKISKPIVTDDVSAYALFEFYLKHSLHIF